MLASQLCAPGGSKARDAVNVQGSAGTCTPYEADSHREQRQAAFEIPSVLRRLASWDMQVSARGYGTVHPIGKPEQVTRVTWWCHTYRGPARGGRRAATATEDGQDAADSSTAASSCSASSGRGAAVLSALRRVSAPVRRLLDAPARVVGGFATRSSSH